MQQVIASSVNDHRFMGAVLVVKDGNALIDQAYGFADLEWNIPNTPATRFRIGSVTKQFTAACVLLLEERGKLTLEDPLKIHLPNSPAAWDRITIQSLLTHTSGIPDLTRAPDVAVAERIDITPTELVSRLFDKPLDFEPGAKFGYSNSGYGLLGHLIETISSQSCADFLRQTIFDPLGMNDTGVDDNTAILPRRAKGYLRLSGSTINAPFISMSFVFGAGDLYSTTADLLKWNRGLWGGKILSPASLTTMTAPCLGNYALGLVVEVKGGRRVIHHGGDINGFNSMLACYPDDDLTVIVLGNLNCLMAEQIAEALAKVALGQEVVLASERKTFGVTREILEEYAGTYALSPVFTITITVANDHLMAQATAQPMLPVYAATPTRFFYKAVPADIEFSRDPVTHAVTHLTLYQNGGEFDAKKLPG